MSLHAQQSAAVTTEDDSDKPDKEISINLASDVTQKSILLMGGEEKFQITVKNLPPKIRSLYEINTGFNLISIKALQKPDNINILANSPEAAIEPISCNDDSGSLLNVTFYDAIWTATTPKQINKLLVDATLASSATYTPKCVALARKLTTIEKIIEVPSNYEANVSVEFTGNKVSELTLSRSTTDWTSHVGFSFVANRGSSYYSKPSGSVEGGYIIAEQNNQDSTIYAASVLFTYPTWQFNNFAWGWTAGLSTSADNIAMLFGPSLIIKKMSSLILVLFFKSSKN